MNQSFYVVGTPIGNIEDITVRALTVLKSVDLILCEDTRVTKKLLSHHGIPTPMMSYHAQSKLSKTEHILSLLEEGKTLALVSDAGTPGISDPGTHLVSQIRAKFSLLNIVAVPGASAVIAALSIAGLPTADFTFLGFLPHKKGRETLFREIAASSRTMVFYESPHRIEKALASLVTFLEPTRRIAVAREITKMFEEVVLGTAQEVLENFSSKPDTVRGEFVVIVEPRV